MEWKCKLNFSEQWNLVMSIVFGGASDGKESACNTGGLGSIPGWGRSPGEGNGYPLHYSCLENSMDRGVWWATVHGVTKSWTWLSDWHFHSIRSNFPGGLVTKNLPAHAGDIGDASSIPGSGRSSGGGNVNPLQYSCLENPTDTRTWRATVHGVTEVDMTESVLGVHWKDWG